jgi:hypothetical protein
MYAKKDNWQAKWTKGRKTWERNLDRDRRLPLHFRFETGVVVEETGGVRI